MLSFLLSLALLLPAWVEPVPVQPPSQPAAFDVVAALESAISDAIAGAEPSVVAIHRFKDDNTQETQAVRGKLRRGNGGGSMVEMRFRPRVERDRSTPDAISFDFGSGVVVGEGGRILTAFHVVRGASRIVVRAVHRQSFEAEIIAADPRSDLAVIAPVSLPGVTQPRLKSLRLGQSEKLRKGSFLVALGNPFNSARDGRPSATWGILSNLARRLEPDLDETAMFRKAYQLPNYPTLLQLDAKLNLGMSGGAVVTLKGELVGLTTMAASPSGFDAMAGYAMPMDRLGRRAVDTLLQGKEIEYGLLGIRADPNFSNRVGEVALNSPAALGDLQTNDEVIAVSGQPIVDFDGLILAVNSFAPGEEVRLRIRRNGKELDKSVVLAKFAVDGEVIATNRPPAWRGLRVDYLSLLSTRAIRPDFQEIPNAGVVVSEVEPGSTADRVGIKKWQVIRQVGDAPIRNPGEFESAIKNLKGSVSLQTEQGTVIIP